MTEEIFIEVSAGETRVGLVARGLLQELFIERTNAGSLLGNIYKGRVLRILPGLQSAFFDIGEEQAAFMSAKDLPGNHGSPDGARERPSITGSLHDGQELLVQVTQDPVGAKGARITGKLSLSSRCLVFMPGNPHLGVSRKIGAEAERDRLGTLLRDLCREGEGLIARTAAEGATTEELVRELEYLRNRWRAAAAQGEGAQGPGLVYEELPLPLRVMRDIVGRNTARILVNDPDTRKVMQDFLSDYAPEKPDCLQAAPGGCRLFDRYRLEEQIHAALDRTASLKSGGYLIIEQTEAMTTIDVNTGSCVGGKVPFAPAYRTNLEAAAAIPRQLRLRNIGGIVIIDFIDMEDEEHKRRVLKVLGQGLQADRMQCRITRISELGLVEMTRKRAYGSLLRTICEPCAACHGRGFIKSAESVCREIFRSLGRRAGDLAGQQCLVMASQAVVDRLLDDEAQHVRALAQALHTSIACQVEPGYTQEQYDIVISLAERTRAG